MFSTVPITISVKPLTAGWALECEKLVEAQLFQSGGDAERSAIRLAAALTQAGWFAEVVVHDLRGVIAGRFGAGADSRLRPQWSRTIH